MKETKTKREGPCSAQEHCPRCFTSASGKLTTRQTLLVSVSPTSTSESFTRTARSSLIQQVNVARSHCLSILSQSSNAALDLVNQQSTADLQEYTKLLRLPSNEKTRTQGQKKKYQMEHQLTNMFLWTRDDTSLEIF